MAHRFAIQGAFRRTGGLQWRSAVCAALPVLVSALAACGTDASAPVPPATTVTPPAFAPRTSAPQAGSAAPVVMPKPTTVGAGTTPIAAPANTAPTPPATPNTTPANMPGAATGTPNA